MVQRYCFFLTCASVCKKRDPEGPLSGLAVVGCVVRITAAPSALAYPSYVYLNYVQVGSTRGLFSVGLVSPTACPVRSAKSRHFSTLSPRIKNPRGPRGKFSPDARRHTPRRKFSTSRHAWFSCHRPCPSAQRS